MRGTLFCIGTCTGPQPSLLTSSACGDFSVLARGTYLIGFPAPAAPRKPGCQAERQLLPPAGVPGRHPGSAAPHRRDPARAARPAAHPSPGRGRRQRQQQPQALRRPLYVLADRSGGGSERLRPRRGVARAHSSPAAPLGAGAGPPWGGDTRIEEVGPPPPLAGPLRKCISMALVETRSYKITENPCPDAWKRSSLAQKFHCDFSHPSAQCCFHQSPLYVAKVMEELEFNRI
ncbi:proline-rich proteoglycan 2-like [Colius striatus]|uniref:proline-rich proteoglycan 2-like n=1 Tax=Colius striatus TaxID=57412 RepID=UPI002B1E60D7|nr:proline-rich proteoglycan 2-like [Colius striatus]